MADHKNSLHIAAVHKGGKILEIGIAGQRGTSKICKCSPSRHAEMDVLYKLRNKNLKNATIYSARWCISRSDNIIQRATMAKPCAHCKDLIRKRGIKKIVYTDWDGNFVSENVYDMKSTLSTGTMLSLNKTEK